MTLGMEWLPREVRVLPKYWDFTDNSKGSSLVAATTIPIPIVGLVINFIFVDR